jgi:hypothetical protein
MGASKDCIQVVCDNLGSDSSRQSGEGLLCDIPARCEVTVSYAAAISKHRIEAQSVARNEMGLRKDSVCL